MDREKIIKNLRKLASLENLAELNIPNEDDPDTQLLEKLKNCKSRSDIIEIIRDWTRIKQTQLFRAFLANERRFEQLRIRQEILKERISKLGELEEFEEDNDELESLIKKIQEELKILVSKNS